MCAKAAFRLHMKTRGRQRKKVSMFHVPRVDSDIPRYGRYLRASFAYHLGKEGQLVAKVQFYMIFLAIRRFQMLITVCCSCALDTYLTVQVTRGVEMHPAGKQEVSIFILLISFISLKD